MSNETSGSMLAKLIFKFCILIFHSTFECEQVGAGLGQAQSVIVFKLS